MIETDLEDGVYVDMKEPDVAILLHADWSKSVFTPDPRADAEVTTALRELLRAREAKGL